MPEMSFLALMHSIGLAYRKVFRMSIEDPSPAALSPSERSNIMDMLNFKQRCYHCGGLCEKEYKLFFVCHVCDLAWIPVRANYLPRLTEEGEECTITFHMRRF